MKLILHVISIYDVTCTCNKNEVTHATTSSNFKITRPMKNCSNTRVV